MANNTLYFKHPITSENCQTPLGFSWTVLIFGYIPPIFRRDWKWAGLIFLTGTILSLILFIFVPIPGAIFFWVNLFFAFTYNKLHIKDLVNKGFHVSGAKTGQLSEIVSSFNFEIPIMENQNTNSSITDKVVEKTDNEDKSMSAEQ
jgi:hypothetical protein